MRNFTICVSALVKRYPGPTVNNCHQCWIFQYVHYPKLILFCVWSGPRSVVGFSKVDTDMEIVLSSSVKQLSSVLLVERFSTRIMYGLFCFFLFSSKSLNGFQEYFLLKTVYNSILFSILAKRRVFCKVDYTF